MCVGAIAAWSQSAVIASVMSLILAIAAVLLSFQINLKSVYNLFKGISRVEEGRPVRMFPFTLFLIGFVLGGILAHKAGINGYLDRNIDDEVNFWMERTSLSPDGFYATYPLGTDRKFVQQEYRSYLELRRIELYNHFLRQHLSQAIKGDTIDNEIRHSIITDIFKSKIVKGSSAVEQDSNFVVGSIKRHYNPYQTYPDLPRPPMFDSDVDNYINQHRELYYLRDSIDRENLLRTLLKLYQEK